MIKEKQLTFVTISNPIILDCDISYQYIWMILWHEMTFDSHNIWVSMIMNSPLKSRFVLIS